MKNRTPPKNARCHSRALITSATLVAMASAAHAQTATPAAPAEAASAPETTLPAVKVKAAADNETGTGPVTGYRAKRGTTATKTDTPLNEVPQSISVITADQIKDQNAQTMQEALRYTAGVRSEMYGLDNRGDWFSLRGGSEGSVLLDGLRVPLTGWYGVVRNEPYAFERVEVLRGPASVIAGQNGPGGVVNMVSKRPQAESLREISVQFGNNDRKQVAADFGGALNTEGTLQYRLVGLYKDSGTQVDHAFDDRQFIAPSLSWKPNADTSLTAYAEYQKDESGNTNGFFPIVGTLRPAPNGPIPSSTFIGEPDWDTYGGTRKRVGYQFEQRLSDDWTLRQNLRHDRIEGKMRSLYANWWEGFVDATGAADPNGTYLNRLWYSTNDTARITNGDLLVEGKLKLGNMQHTVLAGVDAMHSNSQAKSWGDGEATPLDVYNPVYGSFPEPSSNDADAKVTTTRMSQVGLLLQDQIKFDARWVGVVGIRHDRVKTDSVATTPTDPDAVTKPRDSATSKNLGLVYLADGGWSPYASYSESFEPVAPSSEQTFKPKRGKQVEAGVKWSPADTGITAAAAAYELKEKNRVMSAPTADNPNLQVQSGEVTVKGFELEAAANLRAWELVTSYTYMDAQQTAVGNDVKYLGQQLSGIPKHSAAVWATHKFGAYGLPGFKAGLGVRYAGETTDGTGNNTVPSVTLLDLLLAYDRGPWRLAFNVSNLTDKTYIATCLERGDCWFGNERKAVLSVAYRW
jgi:iron complex outermembrane receptor protein